METETIFLAQSNLKSNKPYYLEFQQLKEYYNFQRRLKKDKKDINKQNKWIRNEYYLIDKNWLNKWKEFVKYEDFNKKDLNRDMNDNDYTEFKDCISENKKDLILSPLDNSDIYLKNGEINLMADFIIIDKKCRDLFMKTRLNMQYKVNEKSIPVKFIKEKILFDINKNTKIILFLNNIKKIIEEIIIIFKDQNNKDKILNDIENENIISWLKKRNFEIDSLDELEILEQGSKITIINRNLKMKNMINVNKQMQNKKKIENILIGFKFDLTKDLKTQIQTQVKENLSKFELSPVDNKTIFYSQKEINHLDKAKSSEIDFKPNDNNQNISKIIEFRKKNIDNNFHISVNDEIPNIKYESKNSSPELGKNIQKKPKNLTNEIQFPHKTFLLNIGQSYYINAVIQSLSNISSLTNKLLLRYIDFDINNQPLCVSYSNLLYMIFFYNLSSFNPDLYYKICVKLNPLFDKKNEKEVDAKDYLLFMINTIHKELLPESKENNDTDTDFLKQETDSLNEKKKLKECINKYNLNKTIVSDLFYGIKRFLIKCNNCNTCKYDFQTFNLLTFSLKELKDYKKKNPKSSKNIDLNLYDAFLYEKEERKLEGENGFYCDKCKKMTEGVHKNDIYSLPQILIIVLDRGKNFKDFQGEFWFDEKLDFNDKDIIISKESHKKFYLSGFITYILESENKSKYITFCRNKENEMFFCYNDTSVKKIDVYNAMTYGTPFILFYHFEN